MTEEMRKACYAYAKEIYPNRKEISKKAKEISEKTQMNLGSAKDYINDFFYMRKGEPIHRCMAEDDARYYFENIYKDFGKEALKMATDSVNKYIENDKKNHKKNHPGLEALIKEFNEYE